MNKFLRTASTRRLLATIAGFVIAIVCGTAIAIAAEGSGPVPRPKGLAAAVHAGLAAPQVPGISADVNFTNRLIPSSEILGSDPLLGGGQGHVWISADGRFRLELYGDNGDPAVVVTKSSWWISDPTLHTVYEGALPAGRGGATRGKAADKLPTTGQIQSALSHLAAHLAISGAIPGDVGGQPAYTVRVSPRHNQGLLGQAQLAWDAVKGVPLRFAVYARGDGSGPVLELAATNVSYGSVASSVFDISAPSGYRMVKVATPASGAPAEPKGKKEGRHQAQATGVKAVARRVSFRLAAPSSVAGVARQSVTLLGHGAMIVYGQNLGGVAVIEEPATAQSAKQINLASGSGDGAHGLALPTFTVKGTTAQELDTALGTVVRFTSGGVTFTIIGSVKPHVARAVARGL